MRKRGSLLKKTLLLVIVLVCALSGSQSVSAASKKALNKKAHKAYAKQLAKDQKKYRGGALNKGISPLTAKYFDVDGDKIDEMLIEPGYGYCNQILYDYQNGEVKEVCSVGHGSFSKYYPKKKVIFAKGGWQMGTCYDSYYVWSNGTYKEKASICHYTDYSSAKETGRKYYIGSKTVSKSTFQKYVRKLIGGAKAKSFPSF